jgi:hypothetical protein
VTGGHGHRASYDVPVMPTLPCRPTGRDNFFTANLRRSPARPFNQSMMAFGARISGESPTAT